jgi:hypothetical protein
VNDCPEIPKLPRPRQYHTSILFKSYNITQSTDICKRGACSPNCIKADGKTCGSSTPPTIADYKDYFNSPSNSSCPDQCCPNNNEFCTQIITNSGYSIDIDNEYLLIFGGITQDEVIVSGKNIADNCENIPISKYNN